jgi:D-sedoheptulose 7-phosphate isomerase
MQNMIQSEIEKTIDVLNAIKKDTALLKLLELAAEQCLQSLAAGKKVIFVGNGGSAADSQHLAAELVNRMCHNRQGLASIALTTDTSVLTSIGNDYGFEYIFSRQVEALGQAGDVLIALSTSGKSPNVLKALEMAQKKRIITIGLTGLNGNTMAPFCDYLLKVPSANTQKIQECHILLGHILCGYVEEKVYQNQPAIELDAKIGSN